MMNILSYLKGKSYPGRGIFIGKSKENFVCSYFIMGRSENSKNRVFEETENGIRTKAFCEEKLSDPSLIIYNPVINYKDKLIITNGDQTNTIYDFLKEDKTFKQALKTRSFEPDKPNYTPRISAIVYDDFTFEMSILKSDEGDDSQCLRYFFEYENLPVNTARLIHTYEDDGAVLPSFIGEAKKLSFKEEGIDEFANNLWDSLDSENKVSLYTHFINIKTKSVTTKIINKNK